MRFPSHGPGFGPFGGVLEDIIAGLFFLICLAVVIGLLFVLIRFLLVATRAAELYIAKNSVAQPVQPVAAAPAETTTPAPTTSPTADATTPLPRTRAAKPPTT